ncbi:MAG: efflux RND transporter permease subunit [Gammaproteobacteria bacterium]|nr:efflux RND transporter permease subunit [Gammaproteobacteria bacterium]
MHTAIAWFVRNPVAANLLMFILIIGGVMGLITVNQEEFPNMDVQVVSVTVPYLGAAPEEVEQGVCIRIEEAIEGVEGIDKIRSTSSEGTCSVQAELDLDSNEIVALNEIKSRVDGINSFPVETEKPIVSKLTISRSVLQIALSGNADERVLKEIGREIRDDIAAMDGISQVNLTYVRPYEISIEVSEYALRRHGLTLDEVTRAVRNTSLDMPGGTIKTAGGEILIRSKGQRYWGEEFEHIVIVTREDGTRVTLGEIGEIRDGFEEGDLSARFNGEPGVVIKVMQIGSQDLLQIADDVKAYVEQIRSSIPEGLTLTIWTDSSASLIERLNTLNSTAAGGLVLVLLILALFLRFRLAMWVAAGIPIALLGTLAIFPYADITISTMTVMAFILVLGILVDDAIVVGERVYAHEQMGKPPVQAAIDGTWEVSIPVIFGVLTTMAAFLPLVFSTSRMADFFAVIGYVVIISLVFSIIESQLILPAHLAHRNHEEADHGLGKFWNSIQGTLSDGLQNLANRYYIPFARKAIEWRYVSAAVGVGILILAVALIASGRVVFGFFPSVEGDRIYAQLEMPEGVSVAVTTRAAKQIERGIQELNTEFTAQLELDHPFIVNQLTSIGMSVPKTGPPRRPSPGRSHFAEIVIELVPLGERDNMSAKTVAKRLRELVGDIPDAVKLSFNADMFSAGEPINYELSGKNVEELRTAAAELRAELARYDGVFDITDSFRAGKQEIKLNLLPEARNLGLTLRDLARQVRSAFYGAEAQRVQRGQDDVRVMVRFPESERTSIGDLEDMYIRTPDGKEVPFYSVASFELGRGFSAIRRTDGRRVVNVIADIDRSTIQPEEVLSSIDSEVMPDFKAKYPRLSISLAGEQREFSKAMSGLLQGALLSLVIIYTLLAIPLKSYVQPLVIMSVIPFGAVGAILGHWVMGIDLMFFSALGIVALSGVVVNASLVLVDYVNRRRREGMGVDEALITSCSIRFRPIVLTSVTTFVGLIPLMSNVTPITAPFVPMAVSLAYGVLFATFITLLYVPVLYRIAEDIFGWDAVAQGAQVVGEKDIAPNPPLTTR